MSYSKVLFFRKLDDQGTVDMALSEWCTIGVGIAAVAVGGQLTWWGLLAMHKRFCGGRNSGHKDSTTTPDTEVVFFPDKRLDWGAGDKCGGGMERVLSTLSEAEKSLDLALFSFSNKRLAREVINCMNRGVKVRLVTENTQIDQLGGQVG